MRRGFYYPHELEGAIRHYLKKHKVPPHVQPSVAAQLTFKNWEAAAKHHQRSGPSDNNNKDKKDKKE